MPVLRAPLQKNVLIQQLQARGVGLLGSLLVAVFVSIGNYAVVVMTSEMPWGESGTVSENTVLV